MNYKTYNLGAIEIFAEDVYLYTNQVNPSYKNKNLTWYDANQFLESIKPSGDWRFPTYTEIAFLNREYRSMNLLNFSNSAYWIYDKELEEETSEDWSIGYYFNRDGVEGRRGGIPKSERLCLRPVRSI